AKIQLPEKVKAAVDLEQKVPAAPKKALSVTEIAAAYKGKPVSASRFLYPEIQKLGQNLTLTTPATAKAAAAKLEAKAAPKVSPINIADINLAEIISEIFGLSGDTTYEELDCVGLDTNRDTLVGVIRVKLPYGFNGGLCTAG